LLTPHRLIKMLATILSLSALLYAQADWYGQYVSHGGSSYYMDYYSNYDISVTNNTIKHAIIVVHGLGGSASAHYSNMETAMLASSDNDYNNTVIVAPQYWVGNSPNDRSGVLWWLTNNSYDYPQGDYGWKDGGYAMVLQGNNSVDTLNGADAVSSYSIIDSLILQTILSYPNLSTVIVSGFSAGGQLMDRLAASTHVPLVNPNPDVAIRYLVQAPSTYLYLNEYRWDFDFDTWAIPGSDWIHFSADYNNFKYGLGDLNNYMSTAGPTAIIESAPLRDIVYVVGTDDINSNSLETQNEAMLQGENRLERAVLKKKHMDAYHPANNHSLTLVPGAGHSSASLYQSDEGVHATFDEDLNLDYSNIGNETYFETWNKINLADVNIPAGDQLTVKAGNRIRLGSGFTAAVGSQFRAGKNVERTAQMAMVNINSANQSFLMGRDGSTWYSGYNQHTVTFTYDFQIDVTEVTQENYKTLMGVNPSENFGKTLPVTNMTFGDAALFCNTRSKSEGFDTVYTYTSIIGVAGAGSQLTDLEINYSATGYRLPTEAEWEYACGAGSLTNWYWGNSIDGSYFWYGSNSNLTAHPVGEKIPNSFGIYDMAGNVGELCNDWVDNTYAFPDTETDPIGAPSPTTGTLGKAVRGGSFTDNEWQAQIFQRQWREMNATSPTVGFRCVLPDNS